MPRWSAERRAPCVTGRGTLLDKRSGVPRHGTPCGAAVRTGRLSALYPLRASEGHASRFSARSQSGESGRAAIRRPGGGAIACSATRPMS